MLKKDKFMELLIFVFIFVCGFAGGFQYRNYKKNNESKGIHPQIQIPPEFIMSNDKEIASFERLKALKKFMETVDIDTYYKGKILKEIDYALYSSELDVYKKLGKKTYEKEFSERKADLSKENL